MSTTTLNTKFQLRRDTLENWLDSTKGNDPVLADGEPVLVDIEGDGAYKLKIGDGETVFSELPYYGGEGSGDADWVTLLNKPFYEKQVATKNFTIDYTKETNLSGTMEGADFTACKISDKVYTADTIKNLLYSYEVRNSSDEIVDSNTLISIVDADLEIDPVSIVVHLDGTNLGTNGFPMLISVLDDNVTINNFTVEEKGLYAYSASINGYRTWECTACQDPAHTELKQIDKKYIDYDWDNIENKPFYDDTIPEETIVVDYTGERESVNMGGPILYYHKISDQVYTLEQIQDFIVSIQHEYLNENPTITQTFNDIIYGDIATAENEEEIFWVVSLRNAIIGQYDDSGFPLFIVVSEDNTNLDGIEIAEKGLYAIEFYYEGYVDQKLISITTPAVTNIHKLDKKFVEVDWENVDNKPFGEVERPQIKFELPNPLPETKILMDGGIGEYYQFYYIDVGLSQLGSLLANPSNYYYYYEQTHNNTTTNGTIQLNSANWSYYEKDGAETASQDCDYAVVEYDDNNNHIHAKIIGIGNIDEDTSIIYGEDTIDNIAKGYLLVSIYEECTENQGQYDYYCTQPILISDSSAPIAILSESRLSDSADIELDGQYLYRVGNALLDNNGPIDLKNYWYEYKYNQDGYSSGYYRLYDITSWLPSSGIYATLNNVDMYSTGYSMIVLNVESDNATITWDPIGNDDPNEFITITIPTAGLYFSMDPNNNNQYISTLYSKNTILLQDHTNYINYYIGNNHIDNEISYLYYVGDEESFDPTIEDWRNATAIIYGQDGTQIVPLRYMLPDDDDNDLDYMFTNDYQMIEYLFYVKHDNTTIEFDSNSYVFPYKGFYFFYMIDLADQENAYISELTFPKGTTIKKLDLDYTYHSWNDLEDKPFYSIQHEAETYQLPDPLPQTKFVAEYEPGVIKKYYSLANQEGFEEASKADGGTIYYRHIVNGVEDANLLSITSLDNAISGVLSDDGYLNYYNNGIDSNNHLEFVMVSDDGDTVDGTVFTNEGMYIATLEYQTASQYDGIRIEQFIPDSVVAIADVSAPSTWGSPDITLQDDNDALQAFYRVDNAWDDQDLENQHTYWKITVTDSGNTTEQIIDGYLINAMSMYSSVFNSTNGYCVVYAGSQEQDDTELSHVLEGPFVLLNVTNTDTLTIDIDGDSHVFSDIPAGLYVMNHFTIDTTFEFISIGKNVNFTFDFSGDPDEINENPMTYIECYNTGIETNFTENNIDNLEITIYDDDTELTTLTGGYMLENMSSSFDWYDTWDRLAFGIQVKYKDTQILDAFGSYQYLDKGLWMGRSFLGLDSWETCIIVNPPYEEVKKIDSKYLPRNAGGGGDSFPEGENQGDIIQFDGTDWNKHAFPPAKSANANKLIGFDSSGNYAAVNKSAGGGGVTSWNDLEDKPFDSIQIEKININTSLPSVTRSVTINNGSDSQTNTIILYKISDICFNLEDWRYLATDGSTNLGEQLYAAAEAWFGIGQTNAGSLAIIQPGIIELLGIAEDNDKVSEMTGLSYTITGLDDLEKGSYIGSTFLTAEGANNHNMSIEAHEQIKAIDGKYIKSIDWKKITNPPFGQFPTESLSSITFDLKDFQYCGGTNPTINQVVNAGTMRYYRVGDAITLKQLQGLYARYYKNAYLNNDNLSGYDSSYLYATGETPDLIIKELPNGNNNCYGVYYKIGNDIYPYILNFIDAPINSVNVKSPWQAFVTLGNANLFTSGLYIGIQEISGSPNRYNYISYLQSYGYNTYYQKIGQEYLDLSNIDTTLTANTPFIDNNTNTTLGAWIINKTNLNSTNYVNDQSTSLSNYIDDKVHSTYPGYITASTQVGGSSSSDPTLTTWVGNQTAKKINSTATVENVTGTPTLANWIAEQITSLQPYTFNISSTVPSSGTPNTTITFII